MKPMCISSGKPIAGIVPKGRKHQEFLSCGLAPLWGWNCSGNLGLVTKRGSRHLHRQTWASSVGSVSAAGLHLCVNPGTQAVVTTLPVSPRLTRQQVHRLPSAWKALSLGSGLRTTKASLREVQCLLLPGAFPPGSPMPSAICIPVCLDSYPVDSSFKISYHWGRCK